jgi:hypothetical protein
MAQIPAHRRPHYPPTERMAILELRAARGWNQVQTLPGEDSNLQSRRAGINNHPLCCFGNPREG